MALFVGHRVESLQKIGSLLVEMASLAYQPGNRGSGLAGQSRKLVECQTAVSSFDVCKVRARDPYRGRQINLREVFIDPRLPNPCSDGFEIIHAGMLV